MSIEALKDQARRHEQKEEWKQALDVYAKILTTLEKQERPDIALYNRVGDLCVRGGNLEQAVSHYETAVRLYVEAELPNNAIAVCKKIIRNVPSRAPVYLEMGRIRANQGFVTDARENFIKYAERLESAGNLDEALRALEELADLLPNETDIRLSLAQQLQRHGRPDEAVAQLRAAHRALSRAGDSTKAASILEMAQTIDPEADFEAAAASDGTSWATDSLPLLGDAPKPAETVSTAPVAEAVVEVGHALGDIEFKPQEGAGAAGGAASPSRDSSGAKPVFNFEDAEEEETAPPLPLIGAEDDEDAFGGALPLLGEDDDEEAAPPLPLLGFDDAGGDLTAEAFGESDRDERIGRDLRAGDEVMTEVEVSLNVDLPGLGARLEDAIEDAVHEERVRTPESLIAAGDLDGAEFMLRDLMAQEPLELDHRQRLVEVAYRRGDRQAQADAYVELAQCLERRGGADQAQGVYRQVLQIDSDNRFARQALAISEPTVAAAAAPVASSEDYIDLGSLIFGDDEEEEKSTRFRVAYDDPTGDEQADFHKMLSQFKAKVAENLGADDVRAHHDLGCAYKEMGLVDEAIEEFQAALKASREHLPSYELLGQCFLTKSQPDAAVKTLKRALTLPFEVEDELLGIYYYLGRAFELTGDKTGAVDYYDRVFSLDINFMDVTERLRSLR